MFLGIHMEDSVMELDERAFEPFFDWPHDSQYPSVSSWGRMHGIRGWDRMFKLRYDGMFRRKCPPHSGGDVRCIGSQA